MDIVLAVRQRIHEASAKHRLSATAQATVQVLGKLVSDDCRVLRWIERNHRQLKTQPVGSTSADQAWALAQWIARRQPLTPWELLPAKTRTRRLERIDHLATNLAKLLHQADSPPAPVALDLFQHDRLPPHWWQSGLWQADVSRLREQQLAPMLGRLAWFTRNELARLSSPNPPGPRRQARPLTGDADKRAFVREIAAWFVDRYGTKPAEVIADIVNLVAPDPQAEFDGKRVRQCLNGRGSLRSGRMLPGTRVARQAG